MGIPIICRSCRAAFAESIPPKDRRRFEKELLQAKTGFFDTHPAHKDRIASVRRLGAPGIFHLNLPAVALFNNLLKLSRAVSKTFYRSVVGRHIEMLDEIAMANEAYSDMS